MNDFSKFWIVSELKRRSVWILGLLVTLGIAGLVFVDLFSQRLSETASRDTRKFLSADYTVSSWEGFNPDLLTKLEELVPRSDTILSQTLIASMQAESGQVSAISLGSYEGAYPFYGDWKTSSDFKISDLGANELFLDESAKSKGFKIGDQIKLGSQLFKLKDFVELEPEAVSLFRAGQFKVWIRYDDLKPTGLSGPGSRVRSRAFLKAPNTDSKLFREKFREVFKDPNLRLRSADQSNAQAQKTVAVLRSYLSFVSLCATLLGIVGLFFMFVSDLQKRLPSYLTLRCLGLDNKGLIQATVIPVLISALIGSTCGYFLGSWAEHQLSIIAAKQLKIDLATPYSYLQSYGLALLTSLLALAPVLFFPIKALLRTPTQALFSSVDSGNNLSRSFDRPAVVTCLVLTFILSLITTQNLQLSAFGFLGVIGGLALLSALLWGFIKLLQKLLSAETLKGFSVFYLIQSFTQKISQTFVWVLSISFSLFFLSLGLLLATSIHGQIDKASNGNAPNVLTLGLTQSDFDEHSENFPEQTEWVPYLQSRLFEVDGSPIEEVNKKQSENIDEEGGGPQLREYFVNIRSSGDLFEGEKLSDGTSLFGATPNSEAGMLHASLESKFAERMELDEVGKTFVLDIAGVKLKAVVSSLRQVQWFQFRPNFFIVLSKQELEGAPLSYTALSTVPPDQIEGLQEKIVRLIPHASPLDLTQTGKQIQGLLDKLLLTIESSSLFLFFAALLVIASVSWAKRGEKTSEFALLKCLGLSRRSLYFQLVGEILLSVGFAWLLTWILVFPAGQIMSQRFLDADLMFPPLNLMAGYFFVLSFACIAIYMLVNQSLTRKSAKELFQEDSL